jgi:hypothetical protein
MNGNLNSPTSGNIVNSNVPPIIPYYIERGFTTIISRVYFFAQVLFFLEAILFIVEKLVKKKIRHKHKISIFVSIVLTYLISMRVPYCEKIYWDSCECMRMEPFYNATFWFTVHMWEIKRWFVSWFLSYCSR